ncbi:MAG: DMT family transporter [Phormidesmis sp.]
MSLRQWLWLSLLAFLWGSAFILMEVALPTFSPLLIVTGRMSIAAIILNGVLWSQRERWAKMMALPRSLWLKCGALSLINNLLPFGLVVWGQQYISASLASILISTAPLFTVVLAVFWEKERLTRTSGAGVFLGFSGVVVLIGPEVLRGFDLRGLGEVALLAAALAYSLSGFAGRRFRHVPAQLVSTMTVTMGALIMVPLALFWGDPAIEWQWPAGLAMLALGVFPTAIAYLIYFYLLAEAGVVKTSLVSFLVPLSALLLGSLFLQERLDGQAITGMTLILSGLVVIDGRLLRRLSS